MARDIDILTALTLTTLVAIGGLFRLIG